VGQTAFTRLKNPFRKGFVRSALLLILIGLVLLWLLAGLLLVAARWIDPPTTAVQSQRQWQAWMHGTPYQKRYKFIPLNQISPDLQHAVIAAEDARFYLHHGFDWRQIEIAAREDVEGERTRGASTLTQQLVNILELYLNVVEWGPGVYGADAACRYYDKIPARAIGRAQSAQLAAILPAPLKRRPDRMHRYPEIILKRMSQVGW
jgi:monofunctional biosynthetic peptidoglycan transglycosylase